MIPLFFDVIPLFFDVFPPDVCLVCVHEGVAPV